MYDKFYTVIATQDHEDHILGHFKTKEEADEYLLLERLIDQEETRIYHHPPYQDLEYRICETLFKGWMVIKDKKDQLQQLKQE